MTDAIDRLQGEVDDLQKYIDRGRYLGHSEVLSLLREESQRLMDESFRHRALGQESVGKLKENLAKELLSIISSLPTKLRSSAAR